MDKKIPISDMRGMFLQDGVRPFYYVKKGSLCVKCGGLDDCCISSVLSKHEARMVKPVTECNMFIPVISFAPPFGNMEESFNTLRLGKAWMQRVRAGCRVALQHTKTNEIIGHAEVVSIVAGELNQIAEEHGEFNHMLLGNPVDDSGEEIKKILKRCYGKLFYDSASNLTAIYLKRVKEKKTWERKPQK